MYYQHNKYLFYPYSLFLLSVCFITGCTTSKNWHHSSMDGWESQQVETSSLISHSVLLIGDVGKPDSAQQEPSLKLLQQELAKNSGQKGENGAQSAVLFLGDNIYSHGLRPIGHYKRKESERIIKEQLHVIKNFQGHRFIIPGNHDWNQQSAGGWDAVRRQDTFVSEYLNDPMVFQPKGGCPGPIEILNGSKHVILLIDSEWYLHKYEKPIGPSGGCEIQTEAAFFQKVQEIVSRHADKHILIAMHHPLYSNGEHGGHFGLEDHLFPFRIFNKGLYIPLPIIGSLYPLARKMGVTVQDIPNRRFKQFRAQLLEAIGEHKHVVFAAGHEHNLQLQRVKDIHFIVSGSGSKTSTLIRGKKALFIDGQQGFAKLIYYTNGEVWVEFWEPIADGSSGKCVFRARLNSL